jgi:hypothetical protein
MREADMVPKSPSASFCVVSGNGHGSTNACGGRATIFVVVVAIVVVVGTVVGETAMLVADDKVWLGRGRGVTLSSP